MGVVSDDILWIQKIAVIVVVVVVYNRRMLAVLDNNTPPQGRRKRWQRGEPFFLAAIGRPCRRCGWLLVVTRS